MAKQDQPGYWEKQRDELWMRVKQRDEQWTRLVLGITDRILTPEEAVHWLQHDREVRARNVSDARQRRTPPNW